MSFWNTLNTIFAVIGALTTILIVWLIFEFYKDIINKCRKWIISFLSKKENKK